MSDPLKKNEIEDVLSSIRRLVSEDVRTMAEPEAVAPDPSPAHVAADKLVLTPSLRVEEEAAKARATTNMPEATEDLVAQEIAKSLLSKSEGADPGPRVLTLSKTGADLPSDVETPSDVPQVEDTVEAAAPEAPTEPQDMSEQTDDAAWTSVQTPAVEWQSVRSYSEMQFDPEAAGDGDYAGTEVDALDWGHSVNETAAEVADQDAPETEPEMPQVAASEDVIDAQAVPSSPRAEAPQEEAVLDEDMLRDLVGEIVRQELQGPLGERITRNVRKLVRREINRALASRQMD